jgi:hypothetical protein
MHRPADRAQEGLIHRGNHGASKRRTPEGSVPPIKGSPPHRFARQRRTPKDGEPGPDPWRGADHGGACGSGAHRERRLSASDGSKDPERLRPALHLELHRPLLGRGDRHQAARAHGMGSGIEEPDPCPGRIKTGRVMLDANRADGGGRGDGRIGRGQPNQAPARGDQRQALPTGHHHH